MSQHNEPREREIAERARELFADSVAGLDGRTRSRLARARAKAVEAGARRWRSLFPRGALTVASAGGLAAALVAATILWRSPPPPPAMPAVEATVLNDWDLLLDGENLDLFEDLEFYAWLLEQPEIKALADEDGSG